MKAAYKSFMTIFVVGAVSVVNLSFSFAIESRYTFMDIGTLGDSETVARGINNAGHVVGWSEISGANPTHAFLWRDGTMQDLGAGYAYGINDYDQVVGSWGASAVLWENGVMRDLGRVPNGLFGAAGAINNNGQIVGVYAVKNFRSWGPIGYDHAFLWEDGVMRDLGTLGGLYNNFSGAFSINDSGQVVGYSAINGGIHHAFLWENGVMQDLGALGIESNATAINDSGQVVGYGFSYTSDCPCYCDYAFLLEDGLMQKIRTFEDSPDCPWFRPTDINNSGQIVGFGGAASGQIHAYLWESGVMYDLNDLLPADSGWELEYAYGINDGGAIVGCYVDSDRLHGFVAIPSQPKPTVRLTKARMVSASELGVDLTVSYPPSEDAGQRRFITLSAVVNGTTVTDTVDITRLVENGEEDKPLRWDDGKDYGTRPRVLNFAKDHVSPFETNQKFTLTATAYTSDGEFSPPSSEAVSIYLPVVIVHGYMGPGLLEEIGGTILGPVVYGSLVDYLHDNTQGDFVTGYTSDDTWYKTIWLEYYQSTKWNPDGVAHWLGKIVENACNSTYATRVNLVCHSLGGLIGRYYACYYASYGQAHKNRVQELIMIGTPNLGSSQFYKKTSGLTWTARNVIKVLNAQPLARWLAPRYDCLYEWIQATGWKLRTPDPEILRPDSPWPYPEQFSDSFAPPAGVTYYSIYSTSEPKTPYLLSIRTVEDKFGTWYRVLEDRETCSGDGTVPATSARLNYPGDVNYPLATQNKHASLTADPLIQAKVLELLSDEEVLSAPVGPAKTGVLCDATSGQDVFRGDMGEGPIHIVQMGQRNMIRDNGSMVPDRLDLLQNYPNPFNPSTDIKYQISDVGYPVHTTLKIYNILGQEVAALVNDVKEPGYYSVTWDASEMASGVYFSRLTAGDFVATRSMVLVK